MELCEIPRPGMIHLQVELIDGHRVPCYISSTPSGESKVSGYLMLHPWYSESGKYSCSAVAAKKPNNVLLPIPGCLLQG
ncbi:hypothetical protein PENSUB_9564 [Penicillium subrubescens]|uniref:Uncharacterized protein n=1 Tax=Penicillium subrubescens TaxID=1316194 RepID=A0A1Q5TCM7_9EURO|nr:hypothetical protein PENSUB_9564 [Penicillium subrubescens]